MDLAIANRLGEPRRGQTVELDISARSKACVARVFRTRIVVVARFRRTTLDAANTHDTLARRYADGAHRVVGERRMYGCSRIATVRRTRLFVVLGVGVVICLDNLTVETIVTSTIAGHLVFQRSIFGIASRARIIGLACVDGARIAIFAICIRRAGRRRFGLLRARGFQAAGSNLRGHSGKSQEGDEGGQKARA